MTTPTGQFWHRHNHDGYGEQPTGAPWDIGFPAAPLDSPWSNQATIGRIWPIFAGSAGSTSWPPASW